MRRIEVTNRGYMNRKKFAHSWGRKLFFGLSWPLSLVLGAVYLKSFILPVSVSDMVYFGLTYVGHFGLLNVLVYFILFAPVTSLMPSYYITRLWSLLLILALNLFILVDAICFSTYHLHLYSYLYQFFITEGVNYLIKAEIGKILIYVGLAIVALVIWIRGELHWRTMQGRFSNPIKNWYVVLIFLLVIAGKAVYFYGDVDPKLASLFPLDYNYPAKVSTQFSNQKFYYPKGQLGCQVKNNPNIVLFFVKDLNQSNFNEFDMPNVYQMQKHAVVYTSHLNVNKNYDESLFSFFYSIPSSYITSAGSSKSAFAKELEAKKYEMFSFDNDVNKFNEWISNRSGDEEGAFFLSFFLDQATADQTIQNTILTLQKDDLLDDAHILFVGSSTKEETIPFFYALPNRKPGKVETLTTHYDVLPTLMKNFWNCKNVFSAASTGIPLGSSERDWILSTAGNSFKIQDFKNEGSIEVINGSVTILGNPRRELIFSALETLNNFSHP